MNIFKKAVAASSIMAILLTSSVSFADNAPINDATATTSGLIIDDTITINSVGATLLDDNEITTATITKIDGTAASSTTLLATGTTGENTSSTLTIKTADLEADTSYIITFTTAKGDFGTALLGNTAMDTVTVNAIVQPVLKFEITDANLSLDTLNATSYTSKSTTLEVGTNATAGVVVTAKSTNGGLTSATALHTIDSATGGAYASESYRFSSTSLINNDLVSPVIPTIATDTDMSAAPSNEVAIYTTASAESFDITDNKFDATFKVEAKIAETTPAASDYSDTIIFTATANF